MAKVVISLNDKRGGGVDLVCEPSFAQLREHVLAGREPSEAFDMAIYILHKIYKLEKDFQQQKSPIIRPRKPRLVT